MPNAHRVTWIFKSRGEFSCFSKLWVIVHMNFSWALKMDQTCESFISFVSKNYSWPNWTVLPYKGIFQVPLPYSAWGWQCVPSQQRRSILKTIISGCSLLFFVVAFSLGHLRLLRRYRITQFAKTWD